MKIYSLKCSMLFLYIKNFYTKSFKEGMIFWFVVVFFYWGRGRTPISFEIQYKAKL